jgi:hypothetical protein
MKNQNDSVRLSNYDARVFQLAAGVPIALPPARNYVILSATVDASLVGLTIGDNNGDAGLWPIGIRVISRSDKKLAARISSTVAQSVTVLMTDGDIEVDDSRVVPGAVPAGPQIRAGSVSAVGATASGGTTALVPAASNVRGLVVDTFGFTLNSTIAVACEAALRTQASFISVLTGRIEAGAILAQSLTLPQPVFIEAGIGLEFANIVSPVAVTFRGSLRLL